MDQRWIAVFGAERGIDPVLDQPWQRNAGEVGGDQRKNTENEKTAVAVNEKLDPVVIAKNISVPSSTARRDMREA